MMPGKNPASATPSRKRTTEKLVRPVTMAVNPARMPQVIMIRAIHILAPIFCRTTLLGTSKMK
jgi:hypothetical protein